MAKRKFYKLSIEERLDILKEAEEFFSDLSEAGENSERLGRVKAAAVETVIECLDLFQERILQGGDWTEGHLGAALSLIINEGFIEEGVKNLTEEEGKFYKGGFGLALGILQNKIETIDGLREQEKAYNDILEAKSSTKTIADLIK